jgi:hypothetical protein
LGWYGFGCRRIVDVANLGGKELVKLFFGFTVCLFSLFFPGLNKTSCIGASVILAAFDETVESGGSCLETGAVAGVGMVVERHGMIGGFVILEYLVGVRGEGDRGRHSELDDAILPRTHPEGDVSGGHGVNGVRWHDVRWGECLIPSGLWVPVSSGCNGEAVVCEGVFFGLVIVFWVPTWSFPAFFGIPVVFTGNGNSLELKLFLCVSFFIVVMIVICFAKVFGFLDPLHAGMTGKIFEGIQGDDGLLTDRARPIKIVGL